MNHYHTKAKWKHATAITTLVLYFFTFPIFIIHFKEQDTDNAINVSKNQVCYTEGIFEKRKNLTIQQQRTNNINIYTIVHYGV